MKRDFKGIWIPKEIWLNEKLTVMEKLFLVEIDSLDNSEGCFASNEYFSTFFTLSKNRCSEIIKGMEKKGLISISYEYLPNSKAINKRIIRVLDKSTTYSENRRGYSENRQTYSENSEDNNTSNNTINNVLEDEVKTSPKPKKANKEKEVMDLTFIDEVIDKVKLSKEEYEKLKTKYGVALLHQQICGLDTYISNGKGIKYKDHYKTLNNWCSRKNADIKPTRLNHDEALKGMF